MAAASSEYRTLLRLSWPAVLIQVGMMLTGVVDTLMVARLGSEQLAASALANNWQWSFMAIGWGVVMGIDPLISQAHGRGDGEATALALQRGLLLALLMSLPICGCLLLTGKGLLWLGQPPAVAALAQRYNVLKLSTVPCFLVYSALRQYLQSRGVVAPAAILMYIATALHVLFNWVLIFGHLGFPALGLEGGAIAGSLTTLAMVGGLWWLLPRLEAGLRPRRAWDAASFAPAGLRAVVRLGLPIGLQLTLEGSAFNIAALMAGWIDVTAVASHQIVLNMAALSFMVPLGVSIGASTRVGHLIGQGDHETMRRAVRAALVLGAGVMSFSAFAFVALRHELPRLFSDDATVGALAASILPLAGAFQLADGTQVVAGGVLRGMGRPQAAATLNLLGYYAFALPLGYLLGFKFGLGLPGIWTALALGLIAIALSLLVWVRRTARRPLAELSAQPAPVVL